MNFILTSIFVFVAVTLSVVFEEKLDIYFKGHGQSGHGERIGEVCVDNAPSAGAHRNSTGIPAETRSVRTNLKVKGDGI